MLPTAIAVAILRYRLYDIDVIINRTLTLVYGSLTILLGTHLLHGSVVVLQQLFRGLTGEGSSPVVVASSLPLRWTQPPCSTL